MPGLVPDDAEWALAREMETSGWYVHHLEDNGQEPVRQVLQVAGMEGTLGQTLNAEHLLSSGLGGHVYWVQPADESARGRWLSFLDAYRSACRSASGGEGPRFVVTLSGSLGEAPPAKSIGKVIIDLGECVGSVDLALVAYHHVGASLGGSVKGQVIAQVAVSLARWDVHLLVRLLDEPPNVLFNPADMLRSYAAERGWLPDQAPCWRDGSLRRFLRREEVHSAILAFRDPYKELPSRIWAGQAAVLMPAVERRRLEIIDRNHASLRACLPMQTDYATIRDPSDLDFGALHHLLWQLRHPAQSKAYHLKEVRNALAHLDPLTVEDAFSADILGGEI